MASKERAPRARYPRTKKQREFRLAYWRLTGIEFSDDTHEPFRQRAESQLHWARCHIEDACQNLWRKLSDLEPMK